MTMLDTRPVLAPIRRAALPAVDDVRILRISLGIILAGFGALKFFPGVSPAQPLVTHAVDLLTFGMVTGQAAMSLTATLEVAVGLMFITGTFLRPAVVLFAGLVLGWMSPLVLFPRELFTAHGPTLAAQYVLKDIVFVAAGLVVAKREFGFTE